MVPPTAQVDKRLRISLLLDAYGELLTDKQRTFLRLYYEEDFSFGEIAQEHNVSRQAIFDSVRHGEEALEQFERTLRLVEAGWTRLMQAGLTVQALQQRLAEIRAALVRNQSKTPEISKALAELEELDTMLRESDGEAEALPQAALGS